MQKPPVLAVLLFVPVTFIAGLVRRPCNHGREAEATEQYCQDQPKQQHGGFEVVEIPLKLAIVHGLRWRLPSISASAIAS